MAFPQLRRARSAAVIARVVLFVVVSTLTLLAAPDATAIAWLGLIAAASLPAAAAESHRVIGPLARAAETVLTALAAAALASQATPHVPAGMAAAAVLPYLPVPFVSAMLLKRRTEAMSLLATAAVLLAGAMVFDRALRDVWYVVTCVEWLLLATLAAVAGAKQQTMLSSRRERPQPYAEATRLLTQLRGVARQLPGATLDPAGLAEHLLEDARRVATSTRAAVLSASGGGRLVVLAHTGVDRVAWETALDTESAIADAWASQQPHTSNRSQTRGTPQSGEVSALVVPLIAGVRTVGLVVLETDAAGAYPPPVVARLVEVAAPAALRLEAALLFDEVRSLATTEERQRLAREIHDGVAQELVMVGYGIDNALASLPDHTDVAAEDLRTLRGEVTRVITELRLSLFELRSEVDRYGGLTAAIADYARTVGASAGLRVHLSLDGSTARLPTAVEAELLRIAQEAMTNARKHSGAENLWVTCVVDPPFAQVEISDDGKGIADPRPDGRYGLAIMAERAERIRGRLEITPRVPNGTTVAVALGTAPRRGSV